MTYTKRDSCASCGGSDLATVMDYGPTTLAGFFPLTPHVPDDRRFPMALMHCRDCHLMQINGIIDPDVLFKDYRYLSSVGLSKHFEGLASFISELVPDTMSSIVEIGSNDGVLLRPLKALGYSPVGFEPSDNVSKLIDHNEHRVVNDYFNTRSARTHLKARSVDLVVSCNCLAHIPDINDAFSAIAECLKDDGYLVMEVHYGKRLIDELQFDNVYHEHQYYYTLTSLTHLLMKHGLCLLTAEENPVHAGSLRVVARKGIYLPLVSTRNLIEKEVDSGVAGDEYYSDFGERTALYIALLKKCIASTGRRVIGYGASGRANVLCGLLGLDKSSVSCIIDESPERAGRYINDIPIVRPDEADFSDNPVVLLFAWNYARMIMEKLKDKHVDFIMPFPRPRIITVVEDIPELNTL